MPYKISRFTIKSRNEESEVLMLSFLSVQGQLVFQSATLVSLLIQRKSHTKSISDRRSITNEWEGTDTQQIIPGQLFICVGGGIFDRYHMQFTKVNTKNLNNINERQISNKSGKLF